MADISIETARERIEHVVVLMLENRSFDHMLGLLPDSENYDGVVIGNDRFTNRDDPAVKTSTAHPATDDAGTVFPVDPDHSHEAVLAQMQTDADGRPNAGFVASYRAKCGPQRLADAANTKPPYDLGSLVMRVHRPEAVPVLSRLATQFAVATKWFSPVPGETWPNRNFVHASTSDGAVNIEFGAYTDPTIFELLEKHRGRTPQRRRSWRIYHDGPTQVMAFRKLWNPQRIGNWDPITKFAEHVAANDLATYSFIEPNHHTPVARQMNGNSSSQHPGNNSVAIQSFPGATREDGADFLRGEQLIAQTYQALQANPAVFEKTLLVITYDEHGGLFDHVPPPPTTPPADGHNGGILRSVIGIFVRRHVDFAFDRLGMRVPAVLVSPWIEPGQVDNAVRDHSAVPRTLRELFAPDADPLSAREGAVAPFWNIVSRPSPRQGPDMPSLDDLMQEVSLAEPEQGEPSPPLDTSDSFTQALTAVALFIGDNLELPEDHIIGTAQQYMQPVVVEGGDTPLLDEAEAAMRRFSARAAAGN